MKYLITGGGTGGHIYPALAIADKIKKEDENAEIIYVGTKNGLESKLATKAGYDYKSVRVKSLPRKINKDFFVSIKELILGINDSRKIIKDFKPDVVIGTGGYVCGPVVLMGALKGHKAVIHEQNSYPGITNKILSRFVDKILITFDEARKYFPKKEKITLTGNPVRESILSVDKELAYKKLGINPKMKTILVFGGSGGQKSINDTVIDLIPNIEDKYQLIFVTGERLFEDVNKQIQDKNIEINDNVKVLAYLYDMPEALNICDLIITSAGAITLSEISILGIPSILVPKSYSAENHQEYNAKSFKEVGAAEVILENELNSDLLKDVVLNLLEDQEKLTEMRENSLKLGVKNATQNIFDEINKLTL